MKSIKTVQVMKKTLGLIALVLALASTACQKSSDNGNANQRYTRFSNGMVNNNGTVGCAVNSPVGYGAIWGGAYSQVLPYFMVNNTNIGYVSGQSPNDTTGLRLYGAVNPQTATGTIYIEVWDSIAIQSCSPYRMSFNVDPNQSNINQGLLIATDNDGYVQLQGQISGNYFGGQIGFQNNSSAGGASGSLGQFQASLHNLFQGY